MIQEQIFNQSRLHDEAAIWVARLLSDNVSQRDKQRFSEWLNRSPKHLETFDQMVDTWDSSAALCYLVPAHEIKTEIERNTTEAKPETWSRQSFAQHCAGWLQWLKSWQSGFALAGLACLMVLVYNLLPAAPPTPLPGREYTTAAGEQKRIALPDGSIVELNTQSTLIVSYDEVRRMLTLKNGEAYFDVSPDKRRPFIVDVGQGTVTAVGTAFNIYRKDQETVITVTEGVVGVREKQDAVTPNPASEQVKVSHQVRFDKRGLGRVTPMETRAAVAWRDKTIIFDNIELPQAIAELNRYLEQPVEAGDRSLAKLRVSGTFSLDAPEATLEALVASFNLKIEQPSPQAPLYLRIE